MERAIASAADELNLSFMLPGYIPAIGEKTRSVPADPGIIEEYLQKHNHGSPDDHECLKFHLALYQIQTLKNKQL